MTPPISEAVFQRQITDLLDLHGWDWQWAYSSRRSRPGYPDLTCWHADHGVCWIEIKAQKGRVSGPQLTRIASLRAAGQRAWVIRPSDWGLMVAISEGRA